MSSVEQLQYLFSKLPDVESFWILSLGDMRAKDPLDPKPVLRADFQHQLFDFLQTNTVKPFEQGQFVKCFRKGSALEWCVAPNDVDDHPGEIMSLRQYLSEVVVSCAIDWIKENSEQSDGHLEEHIESLIKIMSSDSNDESREKIILHPSLEELCQILVAVTIASIQEYIKLCSVPHVCTQDSFILVDGFSVPMITPYSETEEKRKKTIIEIQELIGSLTEESPWKQT